MTLETVRLVLVNMGVFLFMGVFAVATLRPEPIEAAAVVCFIGDVTVCTVLALEGRWAKHK